ncbi:uncharacterized protein LOC141906641 isoform X2 [Tubulanus polymorphus]|uniref:uncharacterized protein LOC141906641 isoform X2 n=1 Tax=Tubulanus polymorphus TaxID=672921 RepID=UPI003DA534FC
MKNWIWLVIGVILLLEILFNSEAVPVRNMRNTAPDGVVLDSVNVLPGTNMLLSQEGKTVSITCKQSSSTTTGVHFQLQVNIGTGGSWTPLPLTSSKPVWKIVPKNGKQYKCVATNSKGTKESQIYQSDVISIKIHENPCKVAQFKSLACTCNATSKIGNPKIKVKWYADGYQEGIKDFSTIPPGVNTPVKDGVINRNKMDYRNLIYSTLTQCRLWKYNGIELPKPLQNQILHQTKMDVTYFPAEIQTRDTFTGEPDIRNQGEVVEYICRTLGGRPDPTVIYQQKRRGSEQWEPIPDPQPRKVPLKGGLKGFDTTYKFKADFTLHNGTSFRCAVKKNLTFPEPRQFNPIIVHSPDGVVLNSVNVLPGTNMLLSQEGKTVSITCKQSNTAASGVHFQLQASGAGETWIPLHLISSKPVWKILPEAGKQYKCVATNSAGTKESQIYKSDVISIQINENPCKVAEFQSLACTCEATSKIGNPNIAVKWYADAYTEGVTEFYPIHKQGVNTAEKDGIVNRNQMDYRNLIEATLIQCQLRRYNGLILPRPLQNQILHQTRMDVTSPDAVVLNSVNVLRGTNMLLSQEGKTVSITCKQSSSTVTGVAFQVQVNSGPGGTWTALPTASAPVWVFKLEAGKRYKCVAKNSAGTKESQIYKSDVISIKINENPCKLAEFQSLACTCKATSKIGNPNIAVKWYANGFTNGSTDFDMMHDQGVNTPVKDGVINRNHMQFNFMIDATSIQCSLWRYNGLILPRPLQNQILHQTKMDVTSPDAVVLDSLNVLPGTRVLLSQEGKTVSITCKQSSSTATGVHFQLHVNSGPRGPWTPLPLNISTVWVFKLEAGKQYKCVATNSAGTKESQIYKSDVISININENPCKLAQFQSLACTCKATSKIGNPNIAVKWYSDGFTEGSTEIVNIHEQGVNTPVKDGVINRNQMDYRYMIYATLIQCQLRRYNGIILPRPLQNHILHQTRMDVTYFPDEIQTAVSFTGQLDIRTEGEVVEYTCRTVIGRPDPTVIYQQKRRGSERWKPIPDPQPRKVPLKGGLKGFDTTYKFGADFKLHNGTSFRCAVKENLTFPEPRQFNPIIVHYFAVPIYKKSSENETNAAYIVTVNSNPSTQQVTCDPPAVVQKLSNSQWNITIPTVNSTTTDYRGRCLADGKNERVIDVAGYHHAGPTDEPDPDGGKVFGAVIGVLILLILITLFILCLCGCLRYRKPHDELCRCGNFTPFRTTDDPVDSTQVPLRPVDNEPGGFTDDNEDASSDELCHCCCLMLRKHVDCLCRRDSYVVKIQKCLKETYKRMIDAENYKEVWWSDKFINFNDFFTQEHAKIRSRKERNEKCEEQSVILPDDFEKLFSHDQPEKKHVCLVGEPGMGKTTQIKKQVLSWEKSPFLMGFPMLFYIPLNALPADNACIYTYIYEHLLSREFRKVSSVDAFKRFVQENADKSIFLLDGFDGLKNDEAKEDIVHVTNGLQKAHIVITTRESGGSMIVTDPKYTVISISGFKQEEVIEIMKRKFPTRDPKQLFNKLRDAASPLFKSIYYNPLILHMFCFLYMNKEKNSMTIPSKLTDIYIDLTCFLINKREGIKLSENCFFDDIENSEALQEICQVAYETLLRHQNSFSENRLKLESNMTALTCKEVSPRQKSDRSVQLRFIHKSVHEFLAAVHSVVQFKNSDEIPWNKCAFDQLPDELEKYGELYPRFMAGLLHRHKRNRGLGELFKTLIDKHLKAITIDEAKYEDSLVFIDSSLMATLPDYESFIELQSQSFWLPDQFSIYLNEADWPDDAISEIVHCMEKMLIVNRCSMFKMNILAKILEHKQCPIEVVYMFTNELKPDQLFADEYRALETAIASNTSLQGMVIEIGGDFPPSIDTYNPYLTLCQKSNRMNWFVGLDKDYIGLCYKKLDCGWIKTSRVIESENQLTSGDPSTQNIEEILSIKTEALSAKLLSDIQKSYPSPKHLSLRLSRDKGKNIIGELTSIVPRLKSLHLQDAGKDEAINENVTGEELRNFKNALECSEIETIELNLKELTTYQLKEISDGIGSMKNLKRLSCHRLDFEISRILDLRRRLTVLSIRLRSEADGKALLRYLKTDAVNQLQEVRISSYLEGTEQHNAILRQLKHVSSLRRLEFHVFEVRFNTQDDLFDIVELIENLPHLSDLYIICRVGDRDMIKIYIKSKLKELNKRVRVHLDIL